MCGAVERQQLEAPDTCLKDLCSIRNQVWMVHKQNNFLCLCFCARLFGSPFCFPSTFISEAFAMLAWAFYENYPSVNAEAAYPSTCSELKFVMFAFIDAQIRSRTLLFRLSAENSLCFFTSFSLECFLFSECMRAFCFMLSDFTQIALISLSIWWSKRWVRG